MNKKDKIRLEFIKGLYKYSVDDSGDSYLRVDFLVEKILGFEGKFCPDCFNKPYKYDPDTFAPVCECGWKGNMQDLLTEKQANIKRRKAKLKRLKALDKWRNKE